MRSRAGYAELFAYAMGAAHGCIYDPTGEPSGGPCETCWARALTCADALLDDLLEGER